MRSRIKKQFISFTNLPLVSIIEISGQQTRASNFLIPSVPFFNHAAWRGVSNYPTPFPVPTLAFSISRPLSFLISPTNSRSKS